jgi:hypothetical protein
MKERALPQKVIVPPLKVQRIVAGLVPENLFGTLCQHLDTIKLFVEIHMFTVTVIIVVNKVVKTKVFHFNHFAFKHVVSFGGIVSTPF